jgi:drug/metabolite transporter (DMT)-like permease
MVISLVTPLIAVVIGGIFLGERLPPQTLLGGILIIASIALIVTRRRAKTYHGLTTDETDVLQIHNSG